MLAQGVHYALSPADFFQNGIAAATKAWQRSRHSADAASKPDRCLGPRPATEVMSITVGNVYSSARRAGSV
jgi:hypothetical protein